QAELDSVDALQGYAVGRIDSFLRANGRKLIGWDDILEGQAPTDAVVMSWQGDTSAIRAASAGHDVIMAPRSYLNFDIYQSAPHTQPKAYIGYLPLSAVYAYDPMPAGLAADKASHILGAQGSIRTTYVPTTEQVEYMAFPRAIALAEVAWSDPTRRDWDDFNKRLQRHYQLLQQLHVNYYRPSYTVDIEV